RYDPNYEEKGQDYPVGFVRWTEQRNLEAVLDLMAAGHIDVKPLISYRFPIEEAEKAYELVSGPAPGVGILLKYRPVEEKPDDVLLQRRVTVAAAAVPQDRPGRESAQPVVAFIGAG